jgi:hypothetical protein
MFGGDLGIFEASRATTRDDRDTSADLRTLLTNDDFGRRLRPKMIKSTPIHSTFSMGWLCAIACIDR